MAEFEYPSENKERGAWLSFVCRCRSVFFALPAIPTLPCSIYAQLGKFVENSGAFGLLPLTEESQLRYEAERSTISIDLLSELDAKDGETYILVRHGMKLDVSRWSYACYSDLLPHLGPDLAVLDLSSDLGQSSFSQAG